MARKNKSKEVTKFISNLELYLIYRRLFQVGKFEIDSRPWKRMKAIQERLGNPKKKSKVVIG